MTFIYLYTHASKSNALSNTHMLLRKIDIFCTNVSINSHSLYTPTAKEEISQLICDPTNVIGFHIIDKNAERIKRKAKKPTCWK